MDSPLPDYCSEADPDVMRWFVGEILPHEAALRNWLRVRFPDIADHDDVVQESFLRIWRARIAGPVHASKPFLFATARNLALDLLKQARPCSRWDGQLDAMTLDEDSDTAESVARAQELELLRHALRALPERCREVFTLRRIHGVSQKEIAARLGISEKTVEAQNAIAMQKCVRFFARETALPVRTPAPAPVAAFGALGASPKHA